MREKNKTAAVTNILLKRYLETGISPLFVSISFRKFSNVGFWTRNRGGKRNNSSIGLKAVEKIYKIGRSINSTMGDRII
jgi:hypothetical protein